MMLKASGIVNYLVTEKVKERLNKLEEKSGVSFNYSWVDKKIAIKLAKAYNLSIKNDVVLDGNNNDVVSEIVGVIVATILDETEDNIPFPLP